MTKRVETFHGINDVMKEAMKVAKANGVNVLEDEFVVVQPLANNEGIVIKAEGTGKDREVKVTGLGPGSVFVLPKKNTGLDIYSDPDDNEEPSTDDEQNDELEK